MSGMVVRLRATAALVTAEGGAMVFVPARPDGSSLGLTDDAVAQAFCAPTRDGFEGRLASGICFVVAGLDAPAVAAVAGALWARRPVELFGVDASQDAEWAVECGLDPRKGSMGEPVEPVPVLRG